MLKEVKILKIEDIKVENEFIYDLEVKDNHNFFADNVLVSNCHHIPCNTIYNIAKYTPNAKYRLGISATPYREDGEDMKIEAVSGKIIFKCSVDELVEKNYLVPATINYVKIKPLDHLDTLWLDYRACYEKYVVKNEERNGYVVDIAMREKEKGNVLILVDRIEHGKMLGEKINQAMFISSNSGSEEREEIVSRLHHKSNEVVIATQLFKEGVDFPNLRCLILACGGKSSVALIQRIGRLLRIFKGKHRAIIYDFIDDCKWFKDHYKKRRTLLKGIKVFEVREYDGKIEEQKSIQDHR